MSRHIGFMVRKPLPLILDGSAHGSSSGSSSISLTLSTTKANDTIALFVHTFFLDASQTEVTVSSVSGGGLTWTKRGQIGAFGTTGGAFGAREELWYAIASSVLTSTAITVTLSGAPTNATAIAAAVNGASGWDHVPSDNARGGGISSTPTLTVQLATTAQNTLVLCGTGVKSDLPTAVPSGFSDVDSISNGLSNLRVAYRVFNSPQAAASYPWTGSSPNWLALGDALAS